MIALWLRPEKRQCGAFETATRTSDDGPRRTHAGKRQRGAFETVTCGGVAHAGGDGAEKRQRGALETATLVRRLS